MTETILDSRERRVRWVLLMGALGVAPVITSALPAHANRATYNIHQPDEYKRSDYKLDEGPPARASAYTAPGRDSDGDGWSDVLESIADNGTTLAADKDQQPNATTFTAAPQYLGPSTEVHFDASLRALAHELNYDPVAMYRWVYENIDYESYSYWASRKGALATYLSRGGNSWDQSALLISLLRISGIPARFAEVAVKPQYPSCKLGCHPNLPIARMLTNTALSKTAAGIRWFRGSNSTARFIRAYPSLVREQRRLYLTNFAQLPTNILTKPAGKHRFNFSNKSFKIT